MIFLGEGVYLAILHPNNDTNPKPLPFPKGQGMLPLLLVARNRFALRLAGLQSPRHGCAGWDRLGIAVYSLQLIVYSLQLISREFDDKLQISC